VLLITRLDYKIWRLQLSRESRFNFIVCGERGEVPNSAKVGRQSSGAPVLLFLLRPHIPQATASPRGHSATILGHLFPHELVHPRHPTAARLRGERVGEWEKDGPMRRGSAAEEVRCEGELEFALERVCSVHDLDGDGLAGLGKSVMEDGAEGALPQLARHCCRCVRPWFGLFWPSSVIYRYIEW
jgi:hypothetical protein